MSFPTPSPVFCKKHLSGEVRWPLPNSLRFQQAVLSGYLHCLHAAWCDRIFPAGRPVAVEVHGIYMFNWL